MPRNLAANMGMKTVADLALPFDSRLSSPVTILSSEHPSFGWLLYEGIQNPKKGKGHHWATRQGSEKMPVAFRGPLNSQTVPLGLSRKNRNMRPFRV